MSGQLGYGWLGAALLAIVAIVGVAAFAAAMWLTWWLFVWAVKIAVNS
jgi:hypothetical protein